MPAAENATEPISSVFKAGTATAAPMERKAMARESFIVLGIWLCKIVGNR